MSLANFIRTSNLPFEKDTLRINPAPRFRKSFVIKKIPLRAELCCVGLGYGYFYLNGEKVTEDLFSAPVSDYSKTIWYNRYDVTRLLLLGENVMAAILGNGWYNEDIETVWLHYKAVWRDNPKLALTLVITYQDGTTERIDSDESWVCDETSPYLYNALRCGEIYDARMYEKGWNNIGFDDSLWKRAIIDNNPPTGKFRECMCETIREAEVYNPTKIDCFGERYVFSFPQNISGYVRFRTGSLKSGQRLLIRFAERLMEDGTLSFCNCDSMYPKDVRYATCEFIANGEDFIWNPKFSYFGFRYVEITGINYDCANTVQAVFVHQDIKRKADFHCSDYRLNRLYRMGIFSSYSNMFYMPTDCPTREKLGWANDAQASTEQFIINFDSVNFLKKWYQDVLDSMRDDGAIPAIIPSPNWGYDKWTGPICSGILFEIPYQIYRYTGDGSLLYNNISAFRKHLSYMKTMKNENGMMDYGLCDWAGPWEKGFNASPVPRECTNMLLYIKFLRITRLAAELCGADVDSLLREEECERRLFISTYFAKDGKMIYPFQTALSMCLVLNIYPNRAVVEQELIEAVEQKNCHLDCGMLGMQYLLYALHQAERDDLAFSVVTAEGYPGFISWITERDATTLCEGWKYSESQNHHMYSVLLAWMMKIIGGIEPTKPGFEECRVQPYFAPELSYCSAYEDTKYGRLTVLWKRENDSINVSVCVPDGMKATLVATFLINSCRVKIKLLLQNKVV